MRSRLGFGRRVAGWHRFRSIAVGSIALVVLPACRAALATVLDLPPAKPAPQAAAPPVTPAVAAVPAPPIAVDSVRPEIERFLDPDSVIARLPRDHAGNVDWVRAVRDSIIKPRATLPDRPAPSTSGFAFAYDFTYPGPDTMFDARFPHSTHTEWLACAQCHPRIFPYRNTPIKMADLFQGKLCAECHGKVSFPVVTGCERCHVRVAMPADRAKPELIGNVQLKRVATDSGNAAGVTVDALPVATFPHWVHRMRYRCKVCHLEVFEPKAGANAVTMQRISRGEQCGLCHNGITAFAAGFGACDRCHVPTASVAP